MQVVVRTAMLELNFLLLFQCYRSVLYILIAMKAIDTTHKWSHKKQVSTTKSRNCKTMLIVDLKLTRV